MTARMQTRWQRLYERWVRLDQWLVQGMSRYGIEFLRIALATVFIWFGLLKLAGRSPVAELVTSTVYWVPARHVVPLLGIWETVVGVGLLCRVALRVTLLLCWMLLSGTLLVLVLRPDITFQAGHPLLLTMEGEFIVKNLVLIAAGLVVGGTVQHQQSRGSGHRQHSVRADAHRFDRAHQRWNRIYHHPNHDYLHHNRGVVTCDAPRVTSLARAPAASSMMRCAESS
ncbi:MAG: hypothetical protein HYZ89_04435 [Candidatus Omnitrophica bacterium]|nr:hypothetical protein [Candidatus Omnitrophota bacterium]